MVFLFLMSTFRTSRIGPKYTVAMVRGLVVSSVTLWGIEGESVSGSVVGFGQLQMNFMDNSGK